jgi:hypothetical protein
LVKPNGVSPWHLALSRHGSLQRSFFGDLTPKNCFDVAAVAFKGSTTPMIFIEVLNYSCRAFTMARTEFE